MCKLAPGCSSKVLISTCAGGAADLKADIEPHRRMSLSGPKRYLVQVGSIHARPEDCERERLGARDDAVEFEIFLLGMSIAADGADAANRRRADARRKA